MFSITIAVGPVSDKLNLLFKTEKAAQDAYDLLTVPSRSPTEFSRRKRVQDDFGQKFFIDFSEVHAIIFEDMDLSAEGNIERGLHHARTQATGNSRASSDPTIRTAAMMGGPPMIMQPGGRG